jgi:glucose-6-phosphate 1-epimerase
MADHGAQVLSWSPAQGGPGLYLSDRSLYGGKEAIRGGVPIIFPQFAERGPGQHHGFARRSNWQLAFEGEENGQTVARYRLGDRYAADEDWPHPFDLEFETAFSGQELHMRLTVHNPSDHAWEFGAALHTYLHVGDVDRIAICGLQGHRYIDKVQAGAAATQDVESLSIRGEVDRIYLDVQEPVVVFDGERRITVRKDGFRDVVIWNPGPAEPKADMAPGDFRSFVCVEAGAIGETVVLPPQGRWSGRQSLVIEAA